MTADVSRLRDNYGDQGTGYKQLTDEEAATAKPAGRELKKTFGPDGKVRTTKSLIAEQREDASALQSDFRKRALIVRLYHAPARCTHLLHAHTTPTARGDRCSS